MTKDQALAQAEILEWVLSLRNPVSIVSSSSPVMRRIPVKIRAEIEAKLEYIKLSVEAPPETLQRRFEAFPTVKRHGCVECGGNLWFQRMFDFLCTTCGRREEEAA